jgi:hypothetical protein
MRLFPEILHLWDDAREAFKQARVWARARRLGLSQLACLERHTITGLLCTGARQFVDWSADYRLFSKDQWETSHLFRPVIRGAIRLLSEPNHIVVALDDTLLHKSSKKTPGVCYRRDPLSPAFQTNFILSQRFVQFSILIPQRPGIPAAARAVPIRFEHVPSVKKPTKNADADAWADYREAVKQKNLNTMTCGILRQLREEFDFVHQAAESRLILVVDGSYTNKTVIRGLTRHTTLIGRVRKDAKLYFPHERSPKRYGPPAPTPEELRQDEQRPWEIVEAYAAGKIHAFRIKTLAPVRWSKTGTAYPLRVVVIAPLGYRLRQGGRLLYRQPAYLLCTDPDLPLQRLLQDYLWRWDIEVNHRDEKQIIGVGQAQVRSPKSVDRQPAFAAAAYAMLLLAAMNAYGLEQVEEVLPLPKWQRSAAQCRLSTQRLIQIVRQEVWGHAMDTLTAEDAPGHFVNADSADTKSPELILAPEPPLGYARTG